ncbi:hypothetical protein OWV82_016649 [Melia azedarach]|uniref:Uncharacterized protein n=1 Tax=Melia azedarach TaxID=155640 RepID=A0ACC1XGJ3_MELAZ|nr:hypothetical protein OWV82_016649 [Melia azedarach]
MINQETETELFFICISTINILPVEAAFLLPSGPSKQCKHAQYITQSGVPIETSLLSDWCQVMESGNSSQFTLASVMIQLRPQNVP